MDEKQNENAGLPTINPALDPLPSNMEKVSDATPQSNNVITFCKWSLFIVFVVSLFFPIAITSEPAENPLAISVLFMGWLGIIVGNISWYWIIPTILYLKNISSGKYHAFKWFTKLIYFLIPLIGLIQALFVFAIGRKAPGDIEGGSDAIIVSHSTAFYLYIIMVTYVLLLMTVSNVIIDKKKNDIILKIITSIFLGVSLGVVFITSLNLFQQ